MTRRAEDEPSPEPRRRNGETDKAFVMAARKTFPRGAKEPPAQPRHGSAAAGKAFDAAAKEAMRRVVRIPAAFFEVATDHLCDALEMMTPLCLHAPRPGCPW